MTANNHMKIGAFFDGRPGHEKQTRGILDRLAERIDVEITAVQLARLPALVQAADWLQYCFWRRQSPEGRLQQCDLLIGTGTHTHLPMLQAKKNCHVPVVTCMTPSSLLQKRFDLIFSPQHDGVETDENVFITVGPPNPNRDLGHHLDDHVLVLCGGIDPKSHTWSDENILNGIAGLLGRDPQKKYIVSSSPRTPARTSLNIRLLAEKHGNVAFFDYHDTPSGWIEKQYNQCRQVWVTADSISMVYEALSSGCQVGIIPVQWRKRQSKFQRSEKFLRESGFTLDLKTYLQGEDFPINTKTLNEAERCAEEIVRRFV